MISAPVCCPQFVGRRSELQFLIDRRRALAKARGGIVLIGGDAGIGKSRLVSEFLAGTGKSRGRVAVGRCRPFTGAPYEPLVELLRTFAPGAAPLAPAQSQADQLRAIADAFTTAAQRHALVGIIEDLHWTDAGTLDVLTLLLERLATSRILFVATFRASDLGPDHPHYAAFGALQRDRSVTRLMLAPLTAPETRDFIELTLRAAPQAVAPETRHRVAAIAEGNPFFTEELLRSAIDRTGLRDGAIALPTSVHAAILERLAPLTPAERAILTGAAVIGRRFDAQLLADTHEAATDDVVRALARARALQIVEELAEPMQFRFRHALTREAVYDGLLATGRRPVHRRIALALEARGAPADALGYHWWAAGDRDRALAYGERCGDDAQMVHGYADAIESYERTLTLLGPDGPDAARVRMKIGTCAFAVGAMPRAIESLGAAWKISSATSTDAALLLRLARFLSAALYNDGRTAEAIAFLRAALSTIERCGDLRASEQARLRLANFLVEFGDGEETDRVLAGVDPRHIADEPLLTIAYWQTVCRARALHGDVAGMRAAAETIAAIGEAPNAALPFVEAIAEAGISALALGETELAARCIGRAIDTATALELSASVGDLLVESALVHVVRGEADAARRLVLRALPLIGEGQLGRFRALAAALLTGTVLGDAELLAHEPDSAFIERAFATELPLIYGPLAAPCIERCAARGDAAGVRRLTGRVLRALRVARTTFGAFPLVITLAQHCDAHEAPEVLRVCATMATGGPAAAAASDLGQALIARRFGDPGDATAAGHRAAAAFTAIGWPMYAEFAARTADVSADDAGAVQPAGQRRSGFPPLALLTPRECDIAHLVAGGRTNREIAASLFVSVKLVEKLLSSIYGKLAISSRSQLTAHMLAAGDRAAARPNANGPR